MIEFERINLFKPNIWATIGIIALPKIAAPVPNTTPPF